MFVGEAPGKDENKGLVPFIGKTGDEVNRHYLPLAGLERGGCRFTNSVLCLPATSQHKLDPNRGSDLALLRSCAQHHLYPELADSPQLELVVPMGAFACRAIDPDINLELHHGIPRMTPWGIMAYPMYHPALGMHSPKRMLDIRTDWIRLRKYLAGTLRVPTDPYSNPDYAEVQDPAELDELDPTVTLAGDTETSPSVGPYCLTYSQCEGTGRLIRASRTDLLDALQVKLDRWEAPILFHHWLYDRRIVARMGLQFPHARIVDTMMLAFHLGNLPQGLKALAYRELGMVMDDFEDTVLPYSTPLALEYFKLAQELTWPKPTPRLEQDSKTGEWKMKKPQGMNTKLKRFFTDLSKNDEKDPFHMWEKNWKDEQPMIERAMGPFPQVDIAHVPFEKTLYYACRDADSLFRLYPKLLQMRSRVRSHAQEEWRVA